MTLMCVPINLSKKLLKMLFKFKIISPSFQKRFDNWQTLPIVEGRTPQNTASYKHSTSSQRGPNLPNNNKIFLTFLVGMKIWGWINCNTYSPLYCDKFDNNWKPETIFVFDFRALRTWWIKRCWDLGMCWHLFRKLWLNCDTWRVVRYDCTFAKISWAEWQGIQSC